ncbi:E3 ubiquitin-protein ligase Praja-2 isoform X1 [Oncorhynchus tshawytscha]|uniref:RING-type E3 ubiquitin transferase n=2 Tax=Oncorhynchus tshawytscha TaxID=74940 RepID=A0AAZ3S600_ONCTS|nr:E3 ubiquitin-protein ligase Praja-2 isoform X1 [Oncorhynchus tshawytscha]
MTLSLPMTLAYCFFFAVSDGEKAWGTVMGQEAGKPAWPKPPGGHQTITGRRYGRRHAYVSFRPTSAKHRNPASVEDWPDTEMDGVRRAHSISSKGNISSMLHAIFPVSSNSVHPEVKIKSGKDPPHKKQSTSRQSSEAHSIHYKKSDQPVASDQDQNGGSKKSAEASAWPIPEDEDSNPSNSSILSIVNIDAYEPDSSGGEEEGGQGSDASHGLQKRLDDMIFELGKEFDYLSGLHSYLYTQSSEGTTDCSLRDTESVKDSRTDPRSDSNTEEIPLEWNISEHNRTDHLEISTEFRTPEDLATVGPKGPAELGNDDQRGTQSELVVRPKIRKQTSETHLEKWKSSHGEEAHCGSAKQATKTKCVSAPPFFLTQTERPNQEFLFDYPPTDSYGLSPIERRGEYGEACSKFISDDEKDIWEELEDFNETGVPFMKAEESSECSEGEWSALWPSDSGLEKERGSSQESWVTLPGLDELHSSSLEDVPELSLPPEEPTPLEEGEIPWLMYNEETGSSSDEDPDGMSHFVHPGLFILDGNNNLEDDSSLSEDLDAEWRLLDDFGEGFGMAQAISYVDPQLLTYMALEERLAQAMEAALAHLESLAIDVEQAHPPATEQIIECLPQITILEDPTGQEHCCAICCGEYVKDEIATQLPCHHMFHKICVTLWLQKSGTCPVCRHILLPVVMETTANTSFVSDQDIPPSNHSAAGMR